MSSGGGASRDRAASGIALLLIPVADQKGSQAKDRAAEPNTFPIVMA